MKTCSLILLVVGIGLISAQATAQDTDQSAAEFGLEYATAQQKNLNQLKLYTWKTQTTMQAKGETKYERTFSNRLNEKGEVVRAVLEEESAGRDKKGVRGRRQDKKKDDKEEWLESIVKTATSYILMTKGQEVDFFGKAKITDGEGDMAGTKVVRANNVVMEGDGVSKWIDPNALHPKKIAFQFVMDDHTINGEVVYRPIEKGPNVARFATIRIVDKETVIETEFLEYTKQL
jgi:hypothetical protein